VAANFNLSRFTVLCTGRTTGKQVVFAVSVCHPACPEFLSKELKGLT